MERIQLFTKFLYFLLILSLFLRFSAASEVESLNYDNDRGENREIFTENNGETEDYENNIAVSSDDKTYFLGNETDSANNESSRIASDPITLTNNTNTTDNANITNTNNITSTNVSNLSTSTVLPSPQTSTPSSLTPVTDPSPTNPPRKWKEDALCLCDLHIKACDWNCCCDVDCSDEEKNVFSTCEGSQFYDTKDPGQRENSCFKSYVFYTHNTPYFLERSKSGMFCIVTDNNQEKTELQISESNLENRIRKSRPKYIWNYRRRERLGIPNKFYKYGSVIWSSKRKEHLETKEKFPFSLPAAYQGKLCSLKEPVKFLQNSHTSCIISTSNLEKSCSTLKRLHANYYIQNSYIIKNPSDSKETEIEIRKMICNSEIPRKCKEEAKLPTPFMDNSTLECKNVLHKLNITIVHNGVKGILDVIANVELKDFSVNTKEIHQEFRVKFVWLNAVNVSKVEIDANVQDWPRSGNPGYLIGKPVIMGEKVQVSDTSSGDDPNINESENKGSTSINSTQEEIRKRSDYKDPVVALSKDPSQWMTVLSPGDCDLNFEHPKRRSVLFGMSHSSTCRVKSSTQKYCVDLQLMIGRILLGVEHPENFTKLHKYVAAFGNADPDLPSEWVPVDLENYSFNDLPKSRVERPPNSQLVSSGCDIVSMLHIQIAFAHVGSVDFPQAKILNVLYEFGESYSIPKQAHCKTNCNGIDIDVKTVVTFIDTTKRPVTKVAKWPIVSVKLPSDFFYPFSSPSLSTGNRITKNIYFGLIVIPLLNNFIA